MKTIKLGLIALSLPLLLFMVSGASALLITPSDPLPIKSGDQTSQKEINTIISDYTGSLLALYKQDFGTNGSEDGPFKSSYTTTFITEDSKSDDFIGARIVYDGGPSIMGTPLYLLVKDGNQKPAWYLFSLSWDGKEKIELNDFWSGRGSISHFTIYGPKLVPEPTTMLLIGLGLLGVAGVRRRFKA